MNQKEQVEKTDSSNQPNQETIKNTEENPQKLSAKALKKWEKEKEKAAKKVALEEEQRKKLENDPSKEFFCDYPIIQSTEQTNRKWTKIQDLNDEQIGQQVLVRARIHNSRFPGGMIFLILREEYSTVQVFAGKSDKISNGMLKWISKVPCESIIDVYALVTKPEQEVKSTTQKIELSLEKIFVVSRSVTQLPFQLIDASRRVENQAETYDEDEEQEKQNKVNEESKEQMPVVTMKTRLDNRIIDLRTQSKQAIFRLQSGVCQLFREFLYKQEFVEIHTPKLIGGTSEGGANVFRLKYFNRDACLAQSPQLYKQMAIQGDFRRVFEIGPVFRAENSLTHRHMCEFTGLDLEMDIKEHYFELLDLMGDMFVYIFNNLEKRFAREISCINEQFPFETFKCTSPVFKLTFQEGVQLLKERGINQDPHADIDTPTERKLGEIIKEKYNQDFYMLHRYPKEARPFYTMLCKDDPNYTLSYDFFMRGEEITSGAQRNHDPDSLAIRAEECGIPPDTIKDYIDSFRYGAYPHGGCGIGLERVVFLYCNLKNIRNGSMFPRDPKRITP